MIDFSKGVKAIGYYKMLKDCRRRRTDKDMTLILNSLIRICRNESLRNTRKIIGSLDGRTYRPRTGTSAK